MDQSQHVRHSYCIDHLLLICLRIKEARLMAEFREQDSYIDSDYDTDPSTGPNQNPCARPSTPPLSNSIIAHVELLVRAA